MVAESVSILAITLCIIVIFMRSYNSDYAVSLVPILIVPFANLLGILAFKLLTNTLTMRKATILWAFIVIAGLAIACLLITVFSRKIKSGRNKKLYIIMLSGYNVVLACAFVFQILSPIFA